MKAAGIKLFYHRIDNEKTVLEEIYMKARNPLVKSGKSVVAVVLCLLLKFIPLGGNPLIAAVLVIIIAMPGASVTAVLCQIYNGNIDFAAKTMFLQNLLCVLTIPLICMIL